MTWTADRIKNLQVHFGLTNADLGALIGARQRTISSWRSGERVPTNKMYVRRLNQLAKDAVENGVEKCS